MYTPTLSCGVWWLQSSGCDFPQSGRIAPERNDPKIREILERPYRIVYRVLPGQVEIVIPDS